MLPPEMPGNRRFGWRAAVQTGPAAQTCKGRRGNSHVYTPQMITVGMVTAEAALCPALAVGPALLHVPCTPTLSPFPTGAATTQPSWSAHLVSFFPLVREGTSIRGPATGRMIHQLRQEGRDKMVTILIVEMSKLRLRGARRLSGSALHTSNRAGV